MNNPLIAKLARGGPLDAEDRALLESVCTRRQRLPHHKDIMTEGDVPADVHLILDGFACRYKLLTGGRRAIMALLIPGDFCNLDVATLQRMDHNIGTITACTVVEIPRATMTELCQARPNIAQALRWANLVDEATLRAWLANMGQRPADRQMAHFICELRLRLEVVGMADERGLNLPLTQEDMGDTLGISTVHVNRILQQLRELDLVRMQSREIFIPDVARLEAFAEFNRGYLHLRVEESHALAPPPVP